MRLLPGVRYTAPVDSMGGTFGVDMPNVGGLPADWGRVIIDGVVGNEIGNSGMNAQMVNLDAIAEVRLLNNSYRAEYGQSGGSQLQIVTRGGSSQYHGSGYYYGRHERFNSTEFFRARSQRLQGIDPVSAQVPIPHLWRQRRRPGSEEQEEPLLLLLGGSAPGAASAERADVAHAVGARAAGRLLADIRRQGTADQHSRSAQGRPGMQRRDRRARLLRRQRHPRVDDQLGPPAGDVQADADARVRPADDAGQLQLRHRRSHRHSQAEQRRPDRLAADAERQFLLHDQGLVAGSERRAHHGRAVELAVVLRALQEHGPRDSPATTRRSCARTSCGTPTSAAGSRPKCSTRSTTRSGTRRAARTPASQRRSSIPS